MDDFRGSLAAGSSAMRVLERAVYHGPHLYSATPMVRIQLDLGALEDWPSDRLPGFAAELLALLPGLRQHGCSYREPGGFVRRLEGRVPGWGMSRWSCRPSPAAR